MTTQQGSSFNKKCQQFMADFSAGRVPEMDLIDELVSAGLDSDEDDRQAAVHALYSQLIMPLCDDFSSRASALADRILARMTTIYRRHLLGRETDTLLNDYGLVTADDLLDRQQQTRQWRPITRPDRVKKVLLLSRITIGADIALLSPIIQRLRHSLPQADIILAGTPHLKQIFFKEQILEPCHYQRYSPLAQRLAHWPLLHHHIQQQRSSLLPEEFLLLDPDSRLSQLGLLPLAPVESTFTLHSRKDQAQPCRLTDICNQWLDTIMPPGPAFHPRFWLDPALQDDQRGCAQLSRRDKKNNFTIVINFGVGGDDKKRVPDPFEHDLLTALLAQEKTLIILDSGATPAEQLQAHRLRSAVAPHFPTTLITEDEKQPCAIQHGLAQCVSSIGCLATLIQAADLFIGYDSCCQHLATATTTPSIICFAGAPNERFFARWQPQNMHGSTTTIKIDAELRHRPEQVIAQLLSHVAAQRGGKPIQFQTTP